MQILLNQLGGDGGIVGTVIWFVLFFVLIFLYPRLMLAQLISKIEQSAQRMERMSETSTRMVIKKIDKNASKELRTKIEGFTDFFVIEPSSLDPYGVVKKIDHTIR